MRELSTSCLRGSLDSVQLSATCLLSYEQPGLFALD